MIIERIELENWMSYPRRWPNPDEHGAEEVPPTINLTSEQLTLITGQNGAGKSAVLEAICYALFAKYERGKNTAAIRSGEGTATVRLYFSLPTDSGQVQYCVERGLKARTSSATLKQINEDGSEIVLQAGQGSVTKHITTKLLRDVTYDAFVSTVFLRQAEAGKFMELPQSKQRDQLLKLCGLDIYERIWKKASDLHKGLAKEVSSLEKQLKAVNYATEEHLTAQKEKVQKLHEKREQWRKKVIVARERLRKVEQVAILQNEIHIRRQKLSRWNPLLEEADKIRYAYESRTVWNRVRDSLTDGQKTLKQLHRCEIDIREGESALVAAQEAASKAEEKYQTLQNEYWTEYKLMSELQNKLLSFSDTINVAKSSLENAEKAKKLDEDIERIRAEQAQREILLVDFNEVERKREYFNLLGQAETALNYVLAQLDNAEREQKNAAERKTEAQEATCKSVELQHTITEAKKRREEIQQEVDRWESLERERRESLNRVRATVEERDKAIQAGRCPTCGLDISGDIGTHVHQEVRDLQTEIQKLSTRLQSITISLTASCSELEQLKKEIQQQKGEINKLNNRADLAQDAAKRASKRASDIRDRAQFYWQQHLTKWQVIPTPDWLTPSDACRARMAQELQTLATIETYCNNLRNIKATFKAQASLLHRYKSDRSRLSVLSPIPETLLADLEQELEEAEKRLEEAENERDDLEKNIKLIVKKGKESKKERERTKQWEIRADKHLNGLKITQQNDETNLSKIRESLVGEQQKLAPQFSDLANDLLLAIDDSEVYMRLKEMAKLHAMEARKLTELQEAEALSTRVQAQIDVKQDELNSLLETVGQTTKVQASSELEELQDELKQLDQEVRNTDREVVKIEIDHQTRQESAPKLKTVKDQSWAYKQIESALYPGSKQNSPGVLREQITLNLMEKIAQEASRILQDLGWHMAIVYSKQDGFSVKDKNYDVVRQYKQFSGGERFAVAIAIALAVGQATHGAGNIRCLFIDEGFGALDANNRGRVTTDAIGKLIEKGWRDQVVVITHLDDMKEHFPHRIELKREDDYSVLVKPTEDFL